jgi:UDP-3-O-[3-hydroxymyristoyl] glucosamine N-acyltransferase
MISRQALVETKSVGEGCIVREFATVRMDASLGQRVTIESGAVICEKVALGDECYVGANAVIGCFEDPESAAAATRVGPRSRISANAVIHAGATIGSDVRIHSGVVVHADATIGDGSEIFAGTIIGRRPKSAGVARPATSPRSTATIAARCAVGPHAVIYQGVSVGDDTLIGDGASVREGCTIGARSVVGRGVSLNYDISVGEEVTILDHAWITGRSIIKRGAFISGGVTSADDNAFGATREGDLRGIIVGERARIGIGAILLPTVEIGDDATVAAGAVVTRSVPPNRTVFGIPARLLSKSERWPSSFLFDQSGSTWYGQDSSEEESSSK